MKIGIVGCGLVGSTAAYSLVCSGLAREIVLVDINRNKAEAEALDILHATPHTFPCRVKAGFYSELEGADIIIISAGIHQISGESRLDLLQKNAAIFNDIIRNIIQYAADALILIDSNPVDLLTSYFI